MFFRVLAVATFAYLAGMRGDTTVRNPVTLLVFVGLLGSIAIAVTVQRKP